MNLLNTLDRQIEVANIRAIMGISTQFVYRASRVSVRYVTCDMSFFVLMKKLQQSLAPAVELIVCAKGGTFDLWLRPKPLPSKYRGPELL